MLGQAIAHHYMAAGGRDPALAREGFQHAERALILDSSDPSVLALTATALCYFGRWQDGLQNARRAVDLNPNLAISRTALGMLSIRAGRPEDAIANLRVVESLAPRGAMAFLAVGMRGLAHFQAGQYEQALEAAERAVLIHPGFVFALKDKAVYCERLGRSEEARNAIRRLRAAAPSASVDDFQTANTASFLPPETAADMNATFRKVWEDTQVTA
jgi:Flp pilus assembly protein TadD